MAKSKTKLTPELLYDIIIRIPEGFIHHSLVRRRFPFKHKDTPTLLIDGKTAVIGKHFYDPTRMRDAKLAEHSKILKPHLPRTAHDGEFVDEPINVLWTKRNEQLPDSLHHAVLQILWEESGVVEKDTLISRLEDADTALAELIDMDILNECGSLVYDPMLLNKKSSDRLCHRHQLIPKQDALFQLLENKPGKTASKSELANEFGADTLQQLLELGGVGTFRVNAPGDEDDLIWVRLKGSDTFTARQIATEAVLPSDEDWAVFLDECGDVLREDAREGDNFRSRVLARSYRVDNAAGLLGVRRRSLELAVDAGCIPAFVDPENNLRLPAGEVEAAASETEYFERIADFEVVNVQEIARVSGRSVSTVRRHLMKEKLNTDVPFWSDVKGKWGLPDTLQAFYEQLDIKEAEYQRMLEEQRAAERRQREEERRRRAELRARLVAAFPSWRHEDRLDQHILLHVGPPNSGKTHDALKALISAGSGWYLAPLRLLAFEIFDRLNQQGVLCNLLTGEEHIPIPGAKITASTIEMFNPSQSGECVIVDEAQMLADPDRGWAWTRALMEAQAPEIHVIAPETVRVLIEQLANAAAIPLGAMEHKRLSPIRIADRHWTLQEMPPRTILVAFSRRMVLHLKSELESMQRTVSVIYGSLPPEVRRKQADRFADGETEICIATDAVGMGLNLPADNVCFYELRKFDGQRIRTLYPSEVQQIGGRAGRFGYSEGGQIGATNKRDLRLLKKLYYSNPDELTHARVAPTVEDLELLPGSLADRLRQWAELQSIPRSLKDAIKTSDLTERIELARMLSDAEVDSIGLADALRLVNAPTRQSSRTYWRDCATAILAQEPMPLPPPAPKEIEDNDDLEEVEMSIAQADIYLWLGSRSEFRECAPQEQEVREMREAWSDEIDNALLRKIDTARRCTNCNTPLPLGHRYNLCNNCYQERRGQY